VVGVRSWLALAMLAAAGTAIAACGASSVSGASCENIAGGACSEQIEVLSARHPGARQVDLVCSVPVCDRRGGRGTAVITMPDGTRLNDTFAYVGDPNPPPAPTCVGMAFDICRSIAASHANDIEPSSRIVAVNVACTGSCTANQGTATVTITLADGSQQQSGSSWSGGPP
jgi:hypothetical protein